MRIPNGIIRGPDFVKSKMMLSGIVGVDGDGTLKIDKIDMARISPIFEKHFGEEFARDIPPVGSFIPLPKKYVDTGPLAGYLIQKKILFLQIYTNLKMNFLVPNSNLPDLVISPRDSQLGILSSAL